MLEQQESTQYSLKAEGKHPKNHHTPTWMVEICKITLKKLNRIELPKEADSNLASKGGTLDVG